MSIQTTHEGRVFETRNDLDIEVRKEMIALLNRSLADTTDLATQVKHAHWNVKGSNFQPLHELFDDQSALLHEHADTIAERVTALGGHAMGTARMAASESRLPAYPENAVDGMDCVDALAERFGLHGEQLRNGIEAAGSAGDEDTADLFTELSREVDKQLWFLEAHLQNGDTVEETGVTVTIED